MLRGDVDRLYQALRRAYPSAPLPRLSELDHVREIDRFYRAMDPRERLLYLAWARKEQSGIGIIPLAVSAVPLFGLIFSARVQEPLKRFPVGTILILWVLAAMVMVTGYYVHQRHQAYTTLHITLLEQAVKEEAELRRRKCETSVDTPEAERVGERPPRSPFEAFTGDDRQPDRRVDAP